MSLQYIIDGYNIIHHALFIQQSPKRIPDARAGLLDFIRTRKLCGSPRNKVVVVFDGYSDLANLREGPQGIEVVSSGEESADERIKKIIEQSRNPKDIIVVSDDKEIKITARLLRARAIGIEEFIGVKEEKAEKIEPAKIGLSYNQAHKINEELKKIWLK